MAYCQTQCPDSSVQTPDSRLDDGRSDVLPFWSVLHLHLRLHPRQDCQSVSESGLSDSRRPKWLQVWVELRVEHSDPTRVNPVRLVTS